MRPLSPAAEVARWQQAALDAQEEADQLRAVAIAAKALVRSVQPSIDPTLELVDEQRLTELETALADAGYDMTDKELADALDQAPPFTCQKSDACLLADGHDGECDDIQY